MQQKIIRYIVMLRWGGILLLIALVGIVGYELYDFYQDKVGFTPTKAIETYFDALAQGDYEKVYELTNKDYLTDIYGRPITKGEFFDQLKGLTGGHHLPFQDVEVTRVFRKRGIHYYEVKLHSTVGGIRGTSRLLVEVRRKGKTWVITYPFAIVL
ncbi:MAG: hypothetical protein J7M05_10550 [Anaerolineae bacterium]|nr:hypothetical protein [Anaerolineae bacterium]